MTIHRKKLAAAITFAATSMLIGGTSSAMPPRPDVEGVWDLEVTGVEVNAPGGGDCAFLTEIGDDVIPVMQDGRLLTASDLDPAGTPFVLDGRVDSPRRIRFTISGFGITPGDGGCSIASRDHRARYIGSYDPESNTMAGRVVATAEYAFELDAAGEPAFRNVTWRAEFTVAIS